MTKLETKLIVVIAAAAIIVATMTTLETTKAFNSATTSASSRGLHNCNGCVTTNNLADRAVTTAKIAPGAVSLTTQEIQILATARGSSGSGTFGGVVVLCPTGTSVTGGGYNLVSEFGGNLQVVQNEKRPDGNGWQVTVVNTGPNDAQFFGLAECATIHP
jgi:ABC-type Fe3+-hydroxamate transport system substrate-binding protein